MTTIDEEDTGRSASTSGPKHLFLDVRTLKEEAKKRAHLRERYYVPVDDSPCCLRMHCAVTFAKYVEVIEYSQSSCDSDSLPAESSESNRISEALEEEEERGRQFKELKRIDQIVSQKKGKKTMRERVEKCKMRNTSYQTLINTWKNASPKYAPYLKTSAPDVTSPAKEGYFSIFKRKQEWIHRSSPKLAAGKKTKSSCCCGQDRSCGRERPTASAESSAELPAEQHWDTPATCRKPLHEIFREARAPTTLLQLRCPLSHTSPKSVNALDGFRNVNGAKRNSKQGMFSGMHFRKSHNSPPPLKANLSTTFMGSLGMKSSVKASAPDLKSKFINNYQEKLARMLHQLGHRKRSPEGGSAASPQSALGNTPKRLSCTGLSPKFPNNAKISAIRRLETLTYCFSRKQGTI